jgi:hypothetical protein
MLAIDPVTSVFGPYNNILQYTTPMSAIAVYWKTYTSQDSLCHFYVESPKGKYNTYLPAEVNIEVKNKE